MTHQNQKYVTTLFGLDYIDYLVDPIRTSIVFPCFFQLAGY